MPFFLDMLGERSPLAKALGSLVRYRNNVRAEVRQMLLRAGASGDPETMLRAGAAALRSGIHREAVRPVENVLRRHPSDARLWQLLGLLHRGLGDLEPSIKAFSKAAALLPQDPTIAHGHASASLEAGLPAAHLFKHAARLQPADRSILLQLVTAELAVERNSAPLARIEKKLLCDPTWLGGHSALAKLRWEHGDQAGFTLSYDRATAVRPRDVALWRGYIETLLNAGLFHEVLAVIVRGRAAAGEHPTFLAAEAIARGELNQSEAEALFRLAFTGGSVPVIVHFLRFLLRGGRVGEAVKIAEAIAPRDASNQIWPYLSLAWRLLGDARWEWLEGDPRFIGVYDLTGSLPPLDAIAERLRGLHKALRHPFAQSMRGGTQTEGHLFVRIEPEIRMLRQAVVDAVQQHVAQLPPSRAGHPLLVQRRGPISFAGSWSVRLTGGGRHVEHVHPAGWLSSALYVALPPETESGTGEAGWLSLGEASELRLDLPPIRLIKPKPGRLVLFPSTMWHGTRPFTAGERLTVAFDVERPV
jgi:tetratricopeptide (TPR) repeat protein